jgi:tRNA dimethylallyltransferase
MQMYKGIPIITNKIPIQERHGIPHHLLDLVDLQEQPWTVKKFVKESQKIIREIRSRGKLPILVGGTHYYVHGLLFREALVNGPKREDASEEDGSEEDRRGDLEDQFPILSASTPDIYAKLQEVDPVMARRWHPNDRRKISRSLEIFLQTGRRASDIYKAQRKEEGAESTTLDATEVKHRDVNGEKEPIGMRYSSLIFWLDAQDVALKDRLNARVYDMIANGLLEEAVLMADLEREATAQGLALDKGKGIWVSIGYKELQPFLDANRNGNASEKELAHLRTAGIEAIQASTRQYAKRQNRYIRIRLANALNGAGASDKLFVFDCSDLDQWSATVTAPTQLVTDAFLNGEALPDPIDLSAFAQTILSATDTSRKYQEYIQARICEVCDKTLMTEKEWQGHLTSRGHRKALQGQHKGAENGALLDRTLPGPEKSVTPG